MKGPQTFTVTGEGRFPFDMLRYDACWPARSDDVTALNERGQRSVRLVTNRTVTTAGRWASYGWAVTR